MTSHLAHNLLRTALYVPAANERALEKAPTLGADVIIHDLEDSVAPEAKDAARNRLRAAASGTALHVIRINAHDTPWHGDDVAGAVRLQPFAILLPKASSAGDIHALRRLVTAQNPAKPIALWAMIETASGVLSAAAIAAALGQNGALVLGLNDLSRETGMAQISGRAPMQAALSMTVLGARQAGVGVLDGVFNAFKDTAGFMAECQQGRDFGFDGKTVIHPDQIAIANDIFAPTSEEVKQATRIAQLFDDPANTGRGVISMGGQMIERLHLTMAKDLLHRHKLIQQRGA